MLKHQQEIAAGLAEKWLAEDHSAVIRTIGQLSDHMQAAYIAAEITLKLSADEYQANAFVEALHP